MMLTRSEVGQHCSRESCWVVIHNTAYDLTKFIDAHPGGAAIILKYGGRDATEAFDPVHASDVIEKYLTAEQRLGTVEEVTSTASSAVASEDDRANVPSKAQRRPRLSSVISISDFERAAAALLPPKSFAFIATGAEDESAINRSRQIWRTVRLRPRILRPITHVNTSCSILDSTFSLPIFVCPAGGAKLSHPEGDVVLTQAAGDNDMLHWVCNNAGRSQIDIANARRPGQILFWQIYAKSDLSVTEAEIRMAEKLGFKAVALTVDAIWPGKRERDLRAQLDGDDSEDEIEGFKNEPAVGRPPVFCEFTFESAVKWLRRITDLPIAIKGVQCWEDAETCMQYGVHPWLSNHGGRQLDSAPSALETLVDIRKHCPAVLEKCEVIVDGGITRGSDVVKALALGARAVGVGRGFIYSMVFGRRGVNRAIRILKHEIETTLALLGVQSLGELGPHHVDTRTMVTQLASL